MDSFGVKPLRVVDNATEVCDKLFLEPILNEPQHSTSPELSQRIFGLMKPNFSHLSKSANETSPTTSRLLKSLVQQQARVQSQQEKEGSCANDVKDPDTNIPTLLGLKLRRLHKQKHQDWQQQCSKNSNSILKQQLRWGLKEFVEIDCHNSTRIQKTSLQDVSNLACSALQSLANVAEVQAPVSTLQPPNSNNLQRQFSLHFIANPIIKTSKDFFQLQERQQQHIIEQEEGFKRDDEIELLIDNNGKSEHDLMLADETLGMEHISPVHTDGSENAKAATGQNCDGVITSIFADNKSTKPSRPVQRRRARRKAQSTLDDQAEHLTEMSVRGLDLFRYACITEGVYQCTECAKGNVQKTFKNKYSFQRHAFLYHEGKHRKVFPCLLCGKEFSRPDKMKNHMKMTHENYVSSKEIVSFNPLNYLNATLFSQQQQHKHQLDPIAQLSKQEKQYKSGLEALSLNLEAQRNRFKNNNHDISDVQEYAPANSMDISAASLLKVQENDIINNELVISPMPSPLEMQVKVNSNHVAFSLPQETKNAKAVTQRLEEVKSGFISRKKKLKQKKTDSCCHHLI